MQKIQRADSKDDCQFTKAKKSKIKKSSTLFFPDPFLDKDGLIRVGGTLGNSQEFAEDFKHPVILLKKSFMVELIVRDAHKKVAHAGRGITLNELRSRYWIVNANSLVTHLISNCVVCRHLRGTTDKQMADLREERITSAPPFMYCGVALFGSFQIKQGRIEVERYGVLFTCSASRAVHIETGDSLETFLHERTTKIHSKKRASMRDQIRPGNQHCGSTDQA